MRSRATALLARDEEEVPDSREARRARVGRAWEVTGRLRVRSPLDAPGADGLPEIVIEPPRARSGPAPTRRRG